MNPWFTKSIDDQFEGVPKWSTFFAQFTLIVLFDKIAHAIITAASKTNKLEIKRIACFIIEGLTMHSGRFFSLSGFFFSKSSSEMSEKIVFIVFIVHGRVYDFYYSNIVRHFCSMWTWPLANRFYNRIGLFSTTLKILYKLLWHSHGNYYRKYDNE